MLAKRVFDLTFSIPGVVILSPILLLIALWIKLDTPGPVFFRQERVGMAGKLFRIYKFRTMVVDAEKLGAQLTVGYDSRITGSGKFLRKFKLDELPQLFNVIRGEMSLVGPRPEVLKYVNKYPDEIRSVVLAVLPGITDYASIEYQDENALLGSAKDPERAYVEDILPIKLSYYSKYVNERNIWLDFTIILRTLWVIGSKNGKRASDEQSLEKERAYIHL